jgi:hypothetical protein
LVGGHIPTNERVHLYLGGPSGLASNPVSTLVGLNGAGNEFGFSVASAGDINGDGYGDVVVGAPVEPLGATLGAGPGRVYLYFGSPSGLATTAARVIDGRDGPGGQFGVSVASAGDVNGDGFADIIVAAGAGMAYVYHGGWAGLGVGPATSIAVPSVGAGPIGPAVGAGDVNGDGYSDVIIGASGANGNTGSVYVYLGGPSGLASSPAVGINGPDGASGLFGGSVASAGDVDGDGLSDVLVGAPWATYTVSGAGPGRAYLFLGNSSGVAMTAAWSVTGPDGAGGGFGEVVVGGGDVDGDGHADAFVGALGAPFGPTGAGPGRVYVYPGSTSGLAMSAAATYSGPAGTHVQFGESVAIKPLPR